MGPTSSYVASKTGAGALVAATAAGEESAGPPFRSQADRRQWLLQEKRRWLIEMRLGGLGSDSQQVASAPKLPPIPPAGHQLSNGMDLNALVTPR